MHREKKTRWTLVLSFAMRMAWETIVCCSFGVDPPRMLPVMVSSPDLYTCIVAFPFRLAGAINFQILYRPLFRSPIILRCSLFLFFLCDRWHGLSFPAMSQLFMMIHSLENIAFYRLLPLKNSKQSINTCLSMMTTLKIWDSISSMFLFIHEADTSTEIFCRHK